MLQRSETTRWATFCRRAIEHAEHFATAADRPQSRQSAIGRVSQTLTHPPGRIYSQ